MSLVICQECQQEISDIALFCPVCGWPLREILAKLADKGARSRLRFNPLRRPGKLRLIFGYGLVHIGTSLTQDPALFGSEFMDLAKKAAMDPGWFVTAGWVLMVWGLTRGFFWGCSECRAILPSRNASRCPSCLQALT